MKKILILLGAIILCLTTSLNVYACNLFIYTREDYINMLNWYNYKRITSNLNYYHFVKKYENKIKTPASAISKQTFDDLYDSNKIIPTWNNYYSLEHMI